MAIYNFSDQTELYAMNGNGKISFISDTLQSMFANSPYQSKKARDKRRKNLRVRLNKDIHNCVIIVCGGCYIGTKTEEYYKKYLSQINEIAELNSSKVLFLRGNGDNPSWFDGRTCGFENITFIEDYSVVLTQNNTCLCVGGGVSLERSWMKSRESMTKKQSYFPNEAPVFNKEAIDNIISEHTINSIVTNGSPSLIWPTNSIGNEWMEHDESLKKDISMERHVYDKIYMEFMDHNITLDSWVYTKYKSRYTSFCNDISFVSLGDGDISIVESNRVSKDSVDKIETTIDKIETTISVSNPWEGVRRAFNEMDYRWEIRHPDGGPDNLGIADVDEEVEADDRPELGNMEHYVNAVQGRPNGREGFFVEIPNAAWH